MTKTNRIRYFAACNSEHGFHSFYSQVFRETLPRIYIIKGGPGTGKSSLMRRAADRAQERGFYVEEICCSSDPDSLDGILAFDECGREQLAVLDGTAPHVRELELAGARDEILYVGDFWSVAALTKQREAVSLDIRLRANAYRRLFRYLQAAGQCAHNASDVLFDGLDTRKLKETVAAILTEYPTGSEFEERTMIMRSIGMRGALRFSTFEQAASSVYEICDCASLAHYLFDEIYTQAKQSQMKMWVSRDPLIPEYIDGIYLPEVKCAFVYGKGALSGEMCESKETYCLSMRSYINENLVQKMAAPLAEAENNEMRLMRAAYGVLEEIRDIHFRLEKKYVNAMDFEGLNAYTEKWLEKIIP